MTEKPILSNAEALKKLQNLCASREKCSGDILEKLRQWNIPVKDQEMILGKLIKDGFVNDSRYAGYFVRDKQKLNRWGKEKIRMALERKGVKKEIITEVLSELGEKKFEDTLRQLFHQKRKELEKYNPYERKGRLIRFALQRGFDYDLVFRIVDEYTGD